MEQVPTVNLKFDSKEVDKLTAGFEVKTPSIYTHTDNDKDEMVANCKKFLDDYEKMSVYAERWRYMLHGSLARF